MLPPVQRQVSSRGMIQVARQRIQVGIVHAGLIVTVVSTDYAFQVTTDDQLLVEVTHHHPADRPVQGPQA